MFSVVVTAQAKTTVKASVDRSQILIGERLKLTLTADIPETQPIRFFYLDSLPHFEIINSGKIDTVNTGTGTILSQIIEITSFDSGHWVIPALPLGDVFFTDSISVDVGFSHFDQNQPYHDVKDIMEAKPAEKKEKSYLWWYITGVVLLAALLYLLFRKRAVAPEKPALPPVDPYKLALEQLDKLRKEKLTAKAYYSGITDVFKEYLRRRKELHADPASVNQWKELLSDLNLEPISGEVLQVLTLSASVKFAKYQPSQTDDQNAYDVIRRAIEHIERSAKPPVVPQQ